MSDEWINNWKEMYVHSMKWHASKIDFSYVGAL